MCARAGEYGGARGWGAGWGGWGPWSEFAEFGRRSGAGGRGRARVFDRGDLKYAILRLLERKPMHGYEVMQVLEQESCGAYSASAGSVYPVLQMLQDQGYVTSEERDGKRVYCITDAGRSFLHENRDRADDVADRLSDIAERFAGAPMRDVARSFMRLAQVSWEEAARHAGDADALKRVRDILERAAREMRGNTTTDAAS
jgi:DNA-binding PadR family transcriptional regulator